MFSSSKVDDMFKHNSLDEVDEPFGLCDVDRKIDRFFGVAPFIKPVWFVRILKRVFFRIFVLSNPPSIPSIGIENLPNLSC